MEKTTILKRLGALFALALVTTSALAMPTKKELAAAQPIVADLTAEDLRALKAKEKTPADVAAAHVALAGKADTEAGKYLLLQGAFRLYARGGDYDAAADVLQRMRSEITRLPPELIVEIVSDEMRRVAGSKAPKVLAIFREARRTIKYRKRLAEAEAVAKKRPMHADNLRILAECHVMLGNWPKALEAFAKVGEKAAKWELGKAKDCDAMTAANFWWDYKTEDEEPFKAHAAALYRQAIDQNDVSGLRREMAAKRVAEVEASGVGVASSASSPAPTTGTWAIPANFTAPLERSLKLADGVEMTFCAVPAGTFQMSYPSGSEKAKQGKAHKVTITRPFWFSKTLVTTKQYRELKPHAVRDAQCKEVEALFPESDVVHSIWGPNIDDAIEELNMRFKDQLPKGYVFRLPTEAEWEYAICDAGRQSVYDMKYFWFPYKHSHDLLDSKKYDKDKQEGYAALVLPRSPANRLGIIGAGTDIPQPVIDSIDAPNNGSCNAGKLYEYSQEEIDPLRIGSTQLQRHGINGRWNAKNASGLFRVVIGPDLVAEKKAAEAGKATAGGDVGATGLGPSATDTASEVKEHEIELKTGIKMVFVECPAGTFMAGRTSSPREGNKGDRENNKLVVRRQVTITRPFWIGKYRVTREEWGVFRPQDVRKMNELEKAVGGQKAPFYGMSYDDAMKYCAFLTKNYKSKIPRGYVFRLPTNAEWEYALRANATDRPDNPYGNADGHPPKGADIKADADDALRNELKEKGFKFNIDGKCVLGKDVCDVPPPAAGRKIPNAWGLYDMLGRRQFMLDTVRDKNDAQWEAVDTDPLLVYDGKNRKALCRGSIWWTWMVTFSAPTDETMGVDPKVLRIVVGPDLLAEKKKAGKK